MNLAASLTLLGLCAVASGCASNPNWTQTPNIPNPVLLSRVDRVGGHVSTRPAPIVGVVDAEQSGFVSMETSNTRSGNVVVTTRTTKSGSSDDISSSLAAAGHGDPGVDIHVDELSAGSYAMILAGSAFATKWVGVKARAFKKGQER
ncbi:MAG: hypothetical protein R3B13_01105 [Polyangiaceae bacterium]